MSREVRYVCVCLRGPGEKNEGWRLRSLQGERAKSANLLRLQCNFMFLFSYSFFPYVRVCTRTCACVCVCM